MGVPITGSSWLPRKELQVGHPRSLPLFRTFHATGPGAWSPRKAIFWDRFTSDQDVQGCRLRGGFFSTESVLSDFSFFLLPPFSFLRGPMSRALCPMGRSGVHGSLFVLPFFTTLCSSFLPLCRLHTYQSLGMYMAEHCRL